MRYVILISILFILVGALYVLQTNQSPAPNSPQVTTEREQNEINQLDWEVIAQNLTIPWDIAFTPNGGMFVTERPGNLLYKASSSPAFTQVEVPASAHRGEGGLLGIALHPNFSENQFLYVYLTAKQEGGLINRVDRFVFTEGELTEQEQVVANIPGAPYHDGGRIAFGPDGYLYIATGDATNKPSAQNIKALSGKILRVTDSGDIPEDNPFGNAVYSYGHRNPQGLTWDDQGRLWSTEHGRSGVRSGLDELNLIVKGKNYGWPDSEGDEVKEGTVSPVVHSGADITWAPASAVFVKNADPEGTGSIFFGGLRGEALYEAVLNGHKVIKVAEHFKGEFGRIRTVTKGPDGMLYITTSNRDGRGDPQEGDDKIIRVYLGNIK